MVTEKDLIIKLQSLKQIKPNTQWVALSKTEIFQAPLVKVPVAQFSTFSIFNTLFQRKLVYGFAVLLVVCFGTFGAMKFTGSTNSGLVQVSPEALTAVKGSIEDLKVKSQTLVDASKSNPEYVAVAIDQVKSATKNLTQTLKKDPALVKEVALEINNNKTYLDVEGSSDLKATSDELYKTIDAQMIADLKKTTLTEDQKTVLTSIIKLYDEGKYSDALVNILLLNISNNKNK